LNGVRHLFFDLGHGFETRTARKSGWAVAIGALVLGLVLWMVLRAGLGVRHELAQPAASRDRPRFCEEWGGTLVRPARHGRGARLLGIWFVAGLASLDGASHANVVGWLASPISSALAVLLVVSAAYHALLGLQVVLEDYVADHGKRLASLLVVKFALVVAAVIGVLAVLRIAFGVAA